MRNSIQCELVILLSLLCFTCSSSSAASGAEFPQCNCDGDGDGGSGWAVEGIVRWQKASDLLIAAAYFSIPLELLYFVTCSSVFPFKWILLQFTCFIVLCGLTHLLSVFTYEPHSFVLALGVTVSKFFTALVSFLTAVTLLTLIPQLLRVKVRESFLRLKARELGRQLGLMKRQEEAGWHVRMLTREIRRSLDRHTILYTTLVELSDALALRNCAVWMPHEAAAAMTLTHQLPAGRNSPVLSIPMDDPEVVLVRSTDAATVLNSKSPLGCSIADELGFEFGCEFGAAAAIRMPLLKVSDFKGGTPEVIEARYAILVLVLPRDGARAWGPSELELVAAVADQVAVALSHASVLEESQSMRDKLEQRNRVLLRAKRNLSMANEARNAFQRAVSRGMRMPIHSILTLLSVMQEEENLGPEQRLAIEATARTGSVVSTLIDDAMEISVANREHFALEMSPFRLRSLVKQAASVARCLCDSRGFGFGVRVENSISERAVGDDRRIFHVILHMLGSLLHSREEGFLTFTVYTDREAEELQGRRRAQLATNFSGGYAIVKFEIGVKRPQNSDSIPLAKPPTSEGFDMGLSFSMCKKLVQLMQGDICAVLNSRGQPESMTLVLRLQLQTAASVDRRRSSASSSSLVKGLRVLLTGEDGVNRTVTRKLLEKLGCSVSTAASAAQCLSALSTSAAPFQLVILDLDLNQISGLELGLAIRKFRSGPWPLIVGLTAGAKEDVWEKCIQSGMSGLIRKPVLLRAVKEELIRVLQNT